MTTPDIIQATLTVTRDYDFSPEQVFAAWSSTEAKSQWFACAIDHFTIDAYSLDFRSGGAEHCRGAHPGGVFTNDGIYHYIVENEKIVLSYYMTLDGVPYSVSLTTIEIEARGSGSRLTLTEHNAFLTGNDENKSRTVGWGWGLDRLNNALKEGRLS